VAPLLEVQDLTVEFSRDHSLRRVVDGISFQLHRQETIGIVGESGSGKSVTALSLLRLISSPGKISGGAIHFGTETRSNLLALPEKELRRIRGRDIAMIFQEPMTSLNPVFTCGSQVTEAIRLHLKWNRQQAKERALQLFGEVKLPDPLRIYNAYPHQLSGGQKQRVMVAMAMSCNPSLLIADEPTTALDVTVQSRLLDLMAGLKQSHKMSMIFISHDLAVISSVADRVLVMRNGKIVEEGTVKKIFTEPRHPYTQGLLHCRPPAGKRLRRLPVIPDQSDDEAASGLKTSVLMDHLSADNEISEAETRERHERLIAQPPILSVNHLSVAFPSERTLFKKASRHIRAVDDVSFQVYPGETLGLVGESGSGKSTLARAILRLVPYSKGEVVFDGENIYSLDAESLRRIRKQMQIIFQDPYSSLNPRLTVGYSIMEPMKVHGIGASDNDRRMRTLELLDKVNLPEDSFSRYPHEFSAGQRQRICIARALSVHPKLIICDECVSALDVSIQAQILNLLIRLREEFQLTYIFISHDLSVVRFISDRIAVMNAGKIVETGPADKLYREPASEYTQELIRSIPAIP
jgi:peptide/nickel transport system ATP-binding protein